MENEIRFYLGKIKESMQSVAPGEPPAFVPKYMVTAVKLPTGAIELAVNTENILEKIEYILSAYDDSMRLKTNPEISMQNLMIV
jgi:hypothetical protein